MRSIGCQKYGVQHWQRGALTSRGTGRRSLGRQVPRAAEPRGNVAVRGAVNLTYDRVDAKVRIDPTIEITVLMQFAAKNCKRLFIPIRALYNLNKTSPSMTTLRAATPTMTLSIPIESHSVNGSPDSIELTNWKCSADFRGSTPAIAEQRLTTMVGISDLFHVRPVIRTIMGHSTNKPITTDSQKMRWSAAVSNNNGHPAFAIMNASHIQSAALEPSSPAATSAATGEAATA